MSINYEEVAEQILRHTRQLQAFERAAEILKDIGAVEQNAREQQDRLARLGDECAAAQRARDEAIGETTAAKKKAEALIFDAEIEGKLIVARETSFAKKEAASITAAAAAEVEAANVKKSQAEAESAIARAALEAAQSELADVNAKLASAKASVRTLLGAGS